MTVDERARAGLFLAMQYPVEVPGVSVSNFLRTAKTAHRRRGPEAAHLGQGGQRGAASSSTSTRPSPSATSTRASPAARRSATRSSSSSCSSRRSRSSTRPTPASTSTRCKIVSEGVNRFRAQEGKGVLLITHYTRILRYIKPDFVHVFVDGRIAEQGGPELADKLEAEGYEQVPQGRRSDMTTAQLPGLLPDLEVDPQGLPDPGAHARGRAAAGLPRQRQHLAEAAGRSSTRWSTTSSGTTPTSPAPCTSSARRRPRRTRARATRWRRSSTRRAATRWSSPRTPPRRSTWSPTRWPGPRALPVGPGDEVVITEMEHHSNIVPWQLLTRAHRRDAAVVRAHRRRPPRPVEHRRADHRAHQGRLASTWVSNMLGTINPVADDRPPGPRGRRAGRASTPRRPRRTCRSTCRRSGADFAGLHRPQDASARPASACSGAGTSCSTQLPPFLGGGEMIETVTMDALDVRRVAAQVRGRHAADRRGGRPRRGGRLPRPHRHGRRSTAHEQAITAYALEGLATVPGLTVLGPLDAADRGGAISLRARRHPPARRGPGARLARHRGPGRPPLRASPRTRGSACRARPAMSSYLYTTPAEIDALVEGLDTPARYFKLG